MIAAAAAVAACGGGGGVGAVYCNYQLDSWLLTALLLLDAGLESAWPGLVLCHVTAAI